MYRIKLNPQINQHTATIATIGNFDGMHLGHQELIKQLNQEPQKINAWRMLITFDVLPREYFADKSKSLRLPRIGLLRDKIMQIKELGLIDEVVIVHFNSTMAKMTAESFAKQILQDKLNVSHMLVGHDFRFGANALGSINDLIKSGISVNEFAEYKYHGTRISSSLIRELATEQNLPKITDLLGHKITYSSRVVYGNQLGRQYGVPTINLELRKIRPVLWGIYCGFVYIDGKRYNGVVSIGKNPTVSEGKVYKAEAHLLDVDLDLYGKIATIEILHYLRPELKFTDVDTLFTQIHKDMQDARDFFISIKA